MKILRTYPFLPPLPGGLEKHVRRLSEEQRSIGCEVMIFFNQGNATHSSDVQVLNFAKLKKIRSQALRDAVFYSAIGLNLAIKRSRVDIIHIHGDLSAFLAGVVLAKIIGCKILIGSVHGAIKPGRLEWLYRKTLKSYKFVYCTGAKDAKHLKSIGIESARWQNSGVDEIFYTYKEKAVSDKDDCLPIDVIVVGSCVPVKNHSLVIEIAKAMPELQFLLVGDGPERELLEIRCKNVGIKNLIFSGHLSVLEINEAFHRSAIFLSTSFSEGTPTSILEAMACGLAIITSNSNDYSDLIKDGKNGYVINSFNVEDYVFRIRELLSSEKTRRYMADNNRNDAKLHRWSVVAARLTKWMANV